VTFAAEFSDGVLAAEESPDEAAGRAHRPPLRGGRKKTSTKGSAVSKGTPAVTPVGTPVIEADKPGATADSRQG
jgi:hypothetical protein